VFARTGFGTPCTRGVTARNISSGCESIGSHLIAGTVDQDAVDGAIYVLCCDIDIDMTTM
jgi:hypothetical protein